MFKHRLQSIRLQWNNLQRVVHAKKRQLHALHVDNPIGRYIHVHVISSQITGNGYAWLTTSQSFNSAQRQTLTTPVKVSSPLWFPGSPFTALRGYLPPWHSLSLSAFCPPNESPMIPAVVIHCINEVADRGMLSAGLYRMSMMDERVHSKPRSIARARDIHKIPKLSKLF